MGAPKITSEKKYIDKGILLYSSMKQTENRLRLALRPYIQINFTLYDGVVKDYFISMGLGLGFYKSMGSKYPECGFSLRDPSFQEFIFKLEAYDKIRKEESPFMHYSVASFYDSNGVLINGKGGIGIQYSKSDNRYYVGVGLYDVTGQKISSDNIQLDEWEYRSFYKTIMQFDETKTQLILNFAYSTELSKAIAESISTISAGNKEQVAFPDHIPDGSVTEELEDIPQINETDSFDDSGLIHTSIKTTIQDLVGKSKNMTPTPQAEPVVEPEPVVEVEPVVEEIKITTPEYQESEITWDNQKSDVSAIAENLEGFESEETEVEEIQDVEVIEPEEDVSTPESIGLTYTSEFIGFINKFSQMFPIVSVQCTGINLIHVFKPSDVIDSVVETDIFLKYTQFNNVDILNANKLLMLLNYNKFNELDQLPTDLLIGAYKLFNLILNIAKQDPIPNNDFSVTENAVDYIDYIKDVIKLKIMPIMVKIQSDREILLNTGECDHQNTYLRNYVELLQSAFKQ